MLISERERTTNVLYCLMIREEQPSKYPMVLLSKRTDYQSVRRYHDHKEKIFRVLGNVYMGGQSKIRYFVRTTIKR